MRKAALFLPILIIAFFFYLNNLNSLPPGLYPDEAMNGNNAIEALANKDWKVFYPENNGREGLFINIQSLSMAVFGQNIRALRLPSAFFGILTVLGLYLLTRELFRENSNLEARNSKQIQNLNTQNSKPFRISDFARLPVGQGFRISRSETLALLSAFLLATSFWYINFSHIAFRAIMAPFFLTWALYFLFKSLNAKRYALCAAAGGLLYGLGFHSYIAYRITPLLILFMFWVFWKKENFKIFSVFLLFAVLAALPLGIYFLQNPADFFGRTGQISIFTSSAPWKDLGINIVKTAGMFNFVGDWNWRHNIAGKPLLFWPVGVLFLAGFILSVIKTSWPKLKTRDRPLAIILIWLIIASFPVIISNEGIPHALRSLLMIPPVFILAGLGGLKAYESLKNIIRKPLLLRFIVCFFALLLIFEAYFSYFVTWGKNPNTAAAFNQNYAEIAEKLNVLPKELPKYVIVEAPGVIVRGIPMPAQTVMFLTNTFDLKKREEKNITYLLLDQINQVDSTKEHFITFIR